MCASVKEAVLSSPQTIVRVVSLLVGEFNGLVLIAVLKHGSVVGCEYDQCVVQNFQRVQMVNNLSHAPVRLGDHVASVAERCLPLERRSGGPRDVWLVKAVVKEERLVRVLRHEFLRFRQEIFSHSGIVPKR